MHGEQIAIKLGLLASEYKRIVEILGREPNFTEISIFSIMWSEHCSYKNSILWLKKLPRTGSRLLVEAGEENAGLVAITEDLACVFKIESHNHPSALEPFQGAATGIGGINRDIFTMGARPIAQLNSLRFGDINSPRTQYLLKGVVRGISQYGNAFGIPNIGGEVVFEACYEQNPLVNALSAGIVKVDKVASAIAYGPGNKVYIIGALTGKDGVHGASFASKNLNENSIEELPSVQIGDPFLEKLLLEASLEIIDAELIIGMQDMGAAGIICSTSEMSAKGQSGMEIHLDKVPMRTKDMNPEEILLSESQERMLLVIKPGKEEDAEEIFKKWDINYACIGEVSEDKNLKFYFKNELVACIPANELVLGGGAPVYERKFSIPKYIEKNNSFDATHLEEVTELKEIAWFLLQHPNIASKNWVSSQYDYTIGSSTITAEQPCDAAMVKIKGTSKAIALTIDGNGRYVWANPRRGAGIAVAEAARNIVCAGAKPLAITNCLNFGDPYDEGVYWQFVNTIKGIREVAEALETPVTGGNVSFYNQAENKTAIFPTPTIGMLGILDDLRNKTTSDFKEAGDIIYLVGKSVEDINASEYLYSWHKIKHFDAPYFKLEEEVLLQQTITALIQQGVINSAHDVSQGGLLITVLESAMHNAFGCRLKTSATMRKDAFWFGEAQSRVVVSLNPKKQQAFLRTTAQGGVEVTELGSITKNTEVWVDQEALGSIRKMKVSYESSIEKHLS